MTKTNWMIVILVILVIAGGVSIFKQKNIEPGKDQGIINTTSDNIVNQTLPIEGKAYSVTIVEMALIPQFLNLSKGDSITWTNKDNFKHQIVSDTSNEMNSSVLNYGETYTHTFNSAGNYDYHCGIYPGLKGRIKVA